MSFLVTGGGGEGERITGRHNGEVHCGDLYTCTYPA